MINKLEQLVKAGYKVMIRTRWTDNGWDVWIYHYDYTIQKERPSFAWGYDLEETLDRAIEERKRLDKQ